MKGLLSPVSLIIGITIVYFIIIVMDNINIPSEMGPFPRESSSSFLLDLPGFNYLVNNQVCEDPPNASVNAIMIITSHAGNVATRQAHRAALSRELLLRIGVRRLFLLAVASEEKSHQYKFIDQQQIFDENIVNGDLIQGNFNEAYRNLTYKHMMGLRWVTDFCSSAKYVIKMDDDIILDIFQLLEIIPRLVNPAEKFILGYLLKGMKPIRDPKNKWFVSQKEYPKAYYPPFLSGWMYVTTPELVSVIVWNAEQHRPSQAMKNNYQSFFWIDDVFVTGILSRSAGAKLIDFSKYFAVHPQYFQCCIEAAVIVRAHKQLAEHKSVPCDYIVGPSGGDMELLLKFIGEAKKCWKLGELCAESRNSSQMNRTCVVGRGEAYDWVRRPFRTGEAILKTIKL